MTSRLMTFANCCAYLAGASVLVTFVVAMGSGGEMPTAVRLGLTAGGCALLARGSLMIVNYHGLLDLMRARERQGLDYDPKLQQASRRGGIIWLVGGVILIAIAVLGADR